MRVIVEREPARFEVWVWLLEDTSAGPRIFRPETGTLTEKGPGVERIADGGNLRAYKPSLRLPIDAFEELMREGLPFMPPDQAQARHLDDALKTRDQLLPIVLAAAERGTRPPPGEPPGF